MRRGNDTKVLSVSMVSLDHLIQLSGGIFVVKTFTEGSSTSAHVPSQSCVFKEPYNMVGELIIIVCHEHLFAVHRVNTKGCKAR